MDHSAIGSDRSTLAIGFELGLILLGLLLLWRSVLSPAARGEGRTAALRPWAASGSEFLLFLLFVICGGIAFQIAAVRLLQHASLDNDSRMIVAGAAFQGGMLIGIAAHHFGFTSDRAILPAAPIGALRAGAATFLIALPVLIAVTLVWQAALTACGLPVEKQDLIDLFVHAHSPVLRGTLIVLAVVIAPVTEELVFRRGLFRYLHGRMPRWLAFTAPALLFGALHVNWKSLDGLAALAPLAMLGVVFSAAYERTGRISVTMIAHALFNLNTVVLILAGVNV